MTSENKATAEAPPRPGPDKRLPGPRPRREATRDQPTQVRPGPPSPQTHTSRVEPERGEVTVNKEQRVEALASQAKSIIDRADLENRGRTPDENLEIAHLLKEIGVIRGAATAHDEMNRIGREIGAKDAVYPDRSAFGGRPGDVFVKSEQYRKIADPAARASRWSSGPVEIKATLLEGTLTSPGAGAPLVQTDVRPGVVPTLFQPLTVADLIPSSPTDSNKVRVIVETVADPGAIGVVPEGTAKPEATLEFDEVDEPVKKIASFLPVSDEMLSDTPGIQAYLNGRLTLFVRQQEELQLLQGAGNNNNFLGLLARVPVANRFVSSDAEAPNAADHIYEAITVARQSFLEPDAIVINPVDWADLRLVKDSTENYIGGSPFSNGPAQPGEALFGKRVVITSAMNAGSALVGAFGTGAQLFRRGGLTVEASNSHEDFFRLDLVAIRAETRLALHVARPESLALADLGYAS
jgi:HK97 family phage major capsid protein